MARRIRLIKPDKQAKQPWSTSQSFGMVIVMCVMLILLVKMLPSKYLDRMFIQEPANAPMKGQATPTEKMQAKDDDRPKATPKPYVALPPADETKLLAKVVDQDPLEAKPYFYMLAKVNSMSDTQMDAAVDPAITYDTFADNPVSARGRVVKLQGLLKRLKETKITDNLTAGFDSVWEGNLVDNDLRPIQFVLTQPPPADFFTVNRDYAIIKGVFLKNIVYRNREGTYTASPMIIAKRLVKIVTPPVKETFWTQYGKLLLLVAIVVAVLGLVFLEHGRRTKAALAERAHRTYGETMDLVPDTEAEQDEESDQPVQHVNPGPEKTEEKKGEGSDRAQS